MPINKPQAVPNMGRPELMEIIKKTYPNFVLDKFAVVGLRGYYKKSMGNPDSNDRGIYDDAIFILTEKECIPFNANCDPSRYEKHIAKLKAGVWHVYKFDKHRGKYLALCQRAGNVTVFRDGENEDTGSFGINIHTGGYNTTSSAGCQTIYPTQWEKFITTCQKLCKNLFGDKYRALTYTYVLIDM